MAMSFGEIDLSVAGIAPAVLFRKKIRWWHAVLAMLLSGDCNPIHWWPPYARKVNLPSAIVHGFISFTFVSAAFARALPGAQVRQVERFDFLHPLYYGDELMVSFCEVRRKRNFCWYSVVGTNQNRQQIICGKVVVILP